MQIIKLTRPYTRGAGVTSIQQRLVAHGYDPGAVDGIYGPKSCRAVQLFQAAHGIDPDGVVCQETLTALQAISPSEASVSVGDLIPDFINYLKAQVGHIYVWGAQGETVTDPQWIYKKETTAYNGARAAALFQRRVAEGKDPIKAYDCSGLIMRFLEDRDLVSYDHSSRALYAKSKEISREALAPGDLLFRHNGVQIYHVGAFIGNGMVIESKGRDDGVVMRGINASGFRYWNRYGRLCYLAGGDS